MTALLIFLLGLFLGILIGFGARDALDTLRSSRKGNHD